VSFFTPENQRRASEIIGRYPRPRSATIPLLHLAQEQHGWIPDEAMREIAALVGATPAEVLGTCSFYEMFKRHSVGRYLVNVCATLSCQLLGAEELLRHAEERLGVRVGSTTPDGMFTLEEAECQAACTEAPCLQVNYRYFYRVSDAQADALLESVNRSYLNLRFNREHDRAESEFFYPRTDAGPFLERGILTIGFTTGIHARYHAPADEAKFLDPKKMEAIARTAFAAAWMLADMPERPGIDKTIPATVPRYK